MSKPKKDNVVKLRPAKKGAEVVNETGNKKAKANERGKIGHNSKRRDSMGNLPETDPNKIELNLGDAGASKRDLKHHVDTVIGFKKKVDEAQGRLRNAYAQAQKAGVSKALISETIRWKHEDPVAARLFFAQLAKSFDANGVEVQLEMFDGSNISRGAQIYDEGFKAGSAGKASTENPHDESNANGQLWLQAWHAGQESIIKIGKTGAEAA
jgi:hypothetical protein